MVQKTQKTQIHYKRMVVIHRARILDWTPLKKIFNAIWMMAFMTALDNL
jgi:hypothetical protein